MGDVATSLYLVLQMGKTLIQGQKLLLLTLKFLVLCLWLIHTQTLHEPAVLLGCEHLCFTFLPGPLEAAGLQPLVQQNETVALPVQGLDPVPPSAAEQEQRIAEWIQLNLLLDRGGESVDPTAKIRIAALDVNMVGSGEIIQHDFTARSTASTVAASAPL